jgi:hypothetical protein
MRFQFRARYASSFEYATLRVSTRVKFLLATRSETYSQLAVKRTRNS